MSIVFENSDGWIICHKSLMQDLYNSCLDEGNVSHKFRFKGSYFQILTPLLMNSAAIKRAKNGESIISKKGKKKKIIIKNDNYHFMVKSIIEKTIKAMIECGRNMNLFLKNDPSPEEWFSNNDKAKQAAKEITTESECFSFNEPFHSLFHKYTGDVPIIKTFRDHEYVLPPQSTFLLSDITDVDKLIGTEYDVILIDPPWPNKSVKRKKGYSWLKCEDLLVLPIKKLAKHDALIIVWATNNEDQITFIKDTLFPCWHVQYLADWHWIKVTQRGVLIHPLDSHQKKPYENLILGRFQKSNESQSDTLTIKNHKIIISVPSSIHSHKPPLSEILKSYIPKNAHCLELFARCLLPGWTSCGNEVLKLQSITMFEDLGKIK